MCICYRDALHELLYLPLSLSLSEYFPPNVSTSFVHRMCVYRSRMYVSPSDFTAVGFAFRQKKTRFYRFQLHWLSFYRHFSFAKPMQRHRTHTHTHAIRPKYMHLVYITNTSCWWVPVLKTHYPDPHIFPFAVWLRFQDPIYIIHTIRMQTDFHFTFWLYRCR